ncbi:hypothetical protein [Pseudoclavibacter helvolus]|uniref:hypothetical protein n=1 Tax=Pseudoclavibacter helvolus TaxID=255205 RepID=UPI003C761389
MGKKSGKERGAERPDATQGGPRAKVKKERVQPPKSVVRPASAADTVPQPSLATETAVPPADVVLATPATGDKRKNAKGEAAQSEKPARAKGKGKKSKKDKAKKDKSQKDKGDKFKKDKSSTGDVKKDEAEQDNAKNEQAKNAKSQKDKPTKKQADGKNKPVKKADAERAAEAQNAADQQGTKSKSEKKRKKQARKAEKEAGASVGEQHQHTVRAAALLADEGDDAHGFARLIDAMPGIVALVEQHETAVHRAVFDSYVTAVVEFGVDAAELTPIDIRTSAPDALAGVESSRAAGRRGSPGVDAEATGSARAARRRRPSGINSAPAATSKQAADAPAGPQATPPSVAAKPEQVRRPRSSVRASTRARSGQARAAAPGVAAGAAAEAPGRGASASIGSRTRAGARSGGTGRPRATAARSWGLDEAAAALRPTNNGQRIALAIASILDGDGEVSAVSIAREFERMTWRVPVNVPASIRQAARAGLVDLEGPTGTRLTPDGERYVSGA